MSETLEESVDYWAVNEVLNGDTSYLYYAFDWAYSPQGAWYWVDRAGGMVSLDKSDYEFLKSLL